MNRFVLLAIICFISSQEITGQEWQLFPMGQRSYFSVTQNSSMINTRFVSHERMDGNRRVQYFADNLDTLCVPWELDVDYSGEGIFFLDSIVYENNIITYSNGGDEFIFDLNATSGDYWFSNVEIANFNQLKMTYDSSQIKTFLGISDSVKIYSLKAYLDSTPVAHWVNNHKFILSKNYGLLEGVFFHFGTHSYSYSELHGGQIIGLETDSVVYGFVAPSIEDYLPYQPGDIYKWKGEGGFMIGIFSNSYIYRDSITAIEWKQDAFVYTFNRHAYSRVYGSYNYDEYYTYQENLKKSFDLKFYGQIVKSNSNLNQFLPAGGPMWRTESMILSDNQDIGVEIFNDGLYHSGCSLSFIADMGGSYFFNTKAGLKSYNINFTYFWLLGYKNQHGEYGNTWPFNVREVENSVLKIQLFPNPVQDKLRIEWEGFPDGMLTIYSASGIRILSDTISNKAEVDLSSFNSGIYLVKLEIDGIIQYRKFAKM